MWNGRGMTGRLILNFSALLLAILGVALLFAPGEIGSLLDNQSAPGLAVFVQLIGSGALGFAVLNWMSRGNRIGGIYGRPLGIANLLFFSTGALTMGKAVSSGRVPVSAAGLAALLGLIAVAFAWLMFMHDPFQTESGSSRSEGN